MSKDFCNLHLHTEYSLLDGINKVDKLCEYVKQQGMSACAITDHGVMSGIIEFYKEAKKVGIKPIVGVEAYLTHDKDGLDNKDKTKDNYHCILLAQNEIGLRNIISLSNIGYLNNFYYKPRISIGNLSGRTEGIIATSACLGGIIAQAGSYFAQDPETGKQRKVNPFFNKEDKSFLADEKDELEVLADAIMCLFSDLFPGRFYAELQDLPSWEQTAYNNWLIQKARELNIPLIITSDAHFLTEDDYDTHRLVMAKNTGKILKDFTEDDEGLIYYKEHCVGTPDRMYESACNLGVEEAFYNTMKIADQCNLEITLGEYKFPTFDITTEPDYQDYLKWKEENEN